MALALGTVAALFYGRSGLALSHYDAKAHLVVARRIVDNITPGWQQIGAIWLPLPHVINLLPVQIDTFYQTGISAIAISMLSFAAAVYAAAWLAWRMTGSLAGAAATASVIGFNPNLLYLQATPMTEPLLLALTLTGMAATYRWIEAGAVGWATVPGLLLAGACLTRYEAWAAAPTISAAAGVILWRRGSTKSRALGAAVNLALVPFTAIALFLLWSRLTIGRWLVTEGFFVRENPAAGNAWLVLLQITGGLQLLTGHWTVWLALAGLATIVWVLLRSRDRASLVLALTPIAAAALPAYAYFTGHPFRVRYAVPLVAAAALLIGIGLGMLRRGRTAAAVLVAGLTLVEAPPFTERAPMVLEAQWDRPNTEARRALTALLASSYRGEKILASMASLAHYMQELSRAGFHIRDFVHEGNGEIWTAALEAPRRHVGWILIREGDREGRDVVGTLAKARPALLDGFERVAEAGTVALYRRVGDR